MPFTTPYVPKKIRKTTAITAEGISIGSKCSKNKAGTNLQFFLCKYRIDNAAVKDTKNSKGSEMRKKISIFFTDIRKEADKNSFLYSSIPIHPAPFLQKLSLTTTSKGKQVNKSPPRSSGNKNKKAVLLLLLFIFFLLRIQSLIKKLYLCSFVHTGLFYICYNHRRNQISYCCIEPIAF